MFDRSNSERLRGFGNGQMVRRTFVIVESLSRLKTFLTKTFTHDRLTTVTSKLVTMKRHVTLALFVQRERHTPAALDDDNFIR